MPKNIFLEDGGTQFLLSEVPRAELSAHIIDTVDQTETFFALSVLRVS